MKLLLCLPALLFASITPLASAGNATWSSNPITNDWNTATNWTPNTVPDGGSDVATFGVSAQTEVSLSASTLVNSVNFSVGASPFTILLDHSVALTCSGAGITNNSGVLQTFVSQAPNSAISFKNSASAGDLTTFVNEGSVVGAISNGSVTFNDSSTAGNANFINNPGGTAGGGTIFSNFSDAGTASFTCRGGSDTGGGAVIFQNSSSAANGTFVLEGASGTYSGSGFINFENSATADQASFTLEGGAASGSAGGVMIFYDSSTAATANFAVNGSDIPGAKGAILDFFDSSSVGTATVIINGGSAAGGICSLGSRVDATAGRFEMFGNGSLWIVSNGQVTVGSIEGDGIFSITLSNVFVGSANLSTTFTGTIGTIGAFHKVGTGTLTLTGANTYNRGTFVDAGTLVISNRTGSGTGSGSVNVTAGTLGGKGTISGPVTIGTGSGSGAILAPSVGSKQPLILSLTNTLTCQADSTYTCQLSTQKRSADKVMANGATLANGAQFALQAVGNKKLPSGTVFTVLSNTSATPISGTFANLPDGSTLTAGRNKLLVNYTGGDGNDLTLTVQ